MNGLENAIRVSRGLPGAGIPSEGLGLQTLQLRLPDTSTQLNPLWTKLVEHEFHIQGVLADLLQPLFVCAKGGELPLLRPHFDSSAGLLTVALDVGGDHVEARLELVRTLGLEEVNLGELAEDVEQAEAVPGVGLVHEDDHLAASLDARQSESQLSCLQALGLALLSVRSSSDEVGTQDASLAGDQVELLAGADLLGEEFLRIGVAGGDLVWQHAEVTCHEGDLELWASALASLSMLCNWSSCLSCGTNARVSTGAYINNGVRVIERQSGRKGNGG